MANWAIVADGVENRSATCCAIGASLTSVANTGVQSGELIAGKYRIEHLIGEGGMGAVYQARHVELEQLVAIKVLLTEIASDMARRRFRREARAAARMRGEHVCRVLDVGELPDGSPYMVMEFLQGRDLGAELADRGRLPVSEAVGYALQACEALAEAHAAGVVHRDLKPGNLFLYERVSGPPIVKVLDFGVSKVLDGSSTPGGAMSLTSTSMLVGSPLYMPPEQLESSRDVDGRADIWSLGVVLHEMLTGEPPFIADTMPQLVHAVLHVAPPTFEDAGVEAPAGLEAVVVRALDKDRDTRFATVAELAAALSPFAGSQDRASAGRAQRFLSSPPGTGPATDGSVGGQSTEARTPPTPNGWERAESSADGGTTGRPRWMWIAALLALLGVAALWLLRPGDPAVAPSPATATGGPNLGAKASGGQAAGALTPTAAPPVAPVPSGRVEPGLPTGLPSGVEAPPAAPALPATMVGSGESSPTAAGGADDGSAAEAVAPAAKAIRPRPRRPRPARPAAPRPKPAAAPEPAPNPAEASAPADKPPAAQGGGLPDFGGRR